jgi:hypothetical protein
MPTSPWLAGAAHEQVAVWPYLWFRMGGVRGLAEDRPHAGGLFFRTTGEGRVLVPWGGPGFAERKVDPVDPDDLTAAELECRARARAEADRLRADAPGFESAWLDDYARMLGITESRRVVGDLVLQKDDGDREFPDAIARTGHWTVRGVVYEVPLPVPHRARGAQPPRGRALHLRQPLRPPGHEGDPCGHGHRRGRGRSRVPCPGARRRGPGRDVDGLRRDLAGQGADVGRLDRTGGLARLARSFRIVALGRSISGLLALRTRPRRPAA